MEGTDNSPSSLVPSFARGLPILLVDHDTTSLMYLASLLEQYSYKVTTTELASVALSMIREEKDRFKLVMANIITLDMDSLSFLHVLRQLDIPVILISSEKKMSVALKALADGACFYLEKPISLDDLKYVWQHAYRKRREADNEQQGIKFNQGGSASNAAPANPQSKTSRKGKGKLTEADRATVEDYGALKIACVESMMSANTQKTGSSKAKRSSTNDGSADQKKVRADYSSENSNSNSKKTTEEDSNNISSVGKRQRSVWSPGLQLKFTAALSALGDKSDARPKSILQMMNVPHLTQRQVASHLQKYKAQVQRLYEASTNVFPAANHPVNIYSGYGYGYGYGSAPNNSIMNQFAHTNPGFLTGGIYQVPMAAHGLNQNLFLTANRNALFSSQNQNLAFTSSTTPTQKFGFAPGQFTSGTVSTVSQIGNLAPEAFSAYPANFDPVGISGSSVSPLPVGRSGHDPNSAASARRVPASVSASASMSVPSVSSVPPASATAPCCFESKEQPLTDYSDLLRLLDDEAEGTEGAGDELNPDDVEQFCEWLTKVILDNDGNP